MGLSKFDVGCCCESGDCWLCFDDFDRSDTSDAETALGTCLEEYGTLSTLEIDTNKLKLAGTDAGVVFLADETYSLAAATITIAAHSGSEESKIRLVFGYEDEDNFFFWEFYYKKDGTTYWYPFISLYKRVSGTETLIKDKFMRGVTYVGYYNQIDWDRNLGRAYWFYDQATGWCGFSLGSPTIPSQMTNSSYPVGAHKLDVELGTRFGIGFGDVCDQYVTVDDAIVYIPNKESFPSELGGSYACKNYLLMTRCDVKYCLPPDEATVTIAGIVAGSCDGTALNDTFVLPLHDENDSALTYRTSFSIREQGGIMYRYELPSAICSVKYIDLWVEDNSSATTYSYLYLVDASGGILATWRLYGCCPECAECDSYYISGFPTFDISASTVTVEVTT